MSKTIPILMLGGAKRVSMAEQLIRAGAELNTDITIYSHELSDKEPIASIGKIIKGKRYSEKGVTEELTNIIDRYGIKIILPFIDPSIEIAAECKRINPAIFTPVSGTGVIKAMFDKVTAAEWFGKAGILIPETYNRQNCKFPAIAKPRTGSASKGIIIIETAEQLAKIENTGNFLIQEYISERDEYTVDCYIASDGEIKCIVPRIRLATAGGEVIRTETRRIPELISTSSEIIKSLNLQGAVTLQFIHDINNNRFLLMEINPRLGGGVICSVFAGADIPKMIIQDALGAKITASGNWKDKTLMTRYFKEVMFLNDAE